MHEKINWLVSAVLISALLLLFWHGVTFLKSTSEISGEVIIALIGAITASITIVGSVFVAQLTSISEAKRQRETAARNLKREFYNRFVEVLSEKFGDMNVSAHPSLKINQAFCTEVNRLPLYASQEVVELVNLIASGTDTASGQADFNKLFTLIRNDLCNDDYRKFENISTIHFQIPNRVPVNGS